MIKYLRNVCNVNNPWDYNVIIHLTLAVYINITDFDYGFIVRFDETLVREIQDDFIVESQEDSNDDLDNSSSTTTKGDNSMSLEGPGERTHIKSWSDQGGEDDSLD